MTNEERAAKRKRYTSPIIKLIVGKNKDELTVHEDNLREHSSFFPAALDKKWKEGQSGIVQLPDDEVEILTAYIDWLYSQNKPDTGPEWLFSASLYTFGERILDDRFCDAVLTSILAKVDTVEKEGHCYPSARFIRTLYAGTTAACPARACVVAMYAEHAREDWFQAQDEFPFEFMLDLLKAMTALKKNPVFKPWHPRREQWFKSKRK